MKPACAAFATLSASSSPAITSAPPAFSAWQLARPEPPSPNTAIVLPAKEVTGIMIFSPSFRGVRSTNPESQDSGLPLRGLRNDDGGDPNRSPQFQRGQAGQRQ